MTFLLFLSLTTASAAIEIWVILKAVETGNISFFKGAVSIINAGALIYFIRLFAKLVKRTFIDKDLITEEDLKRYFRNRLDRINMHSNLDPAKKEALFRGLLGETLRMTEAILRNWVGSYQYELSIFFGQENPDIIAYYETGGQDTPRSKLLREQDPAYYRKGGYKVVELLNKPSNEVIIIPKTRNPEVNYKFLSEKQKEKIKSTLLYCFCVKTPMALVVVCNSPDAINKQDSRLVNLIHAVGMAMQCDNNLSSRV